MRAPLPRPDDSAHVLVVDDDRRIRELLSRFLVEHGYRVTTAAHAGEARARLQGLVFDALILDVMMPGESGFDLARHIRAGSATPILMLTARADAGDRVTGLEIGADDYLPKPFEPRELLLRLGNILKRAAPAEPAAPQAPIVARFGPFAYHVERGELINGDDPVRLTDREREILTLLARAYGGVVTREAMAAGGGAVGERTVDVQMNRLRRKVEADPANPRWLMTVRGQGYRLLIDT